MTRYERKLFFERLITLRDEYREQAHVATELTIEGVFAFAAAAYSAAEAVEAATTVMKVAKKAD